MRRPRRLVQRTIKTVWGTASSWSFIVPIAGCAAAVVHWLPMRYGAVPSTAILLSAAYGTALWHQGWHTRTTLSRNHERALTAYRLVPGIGAAVMWCATMVIFPVWDTVWAAAACIVGVAVAKAALVTLSEAYVNRTEVEADDAPWKWADRTGAREAVAVAMVLIFAASVVGAAAQSDTRSDQGKDDTEQTTTTVAPTTTAPTTTEPEGPQPPPADPVTGGDTDYTG